MSKEPTKVQPIPLQGGLNLAASPLAVKPGQAFVLHNYRCNSLGGYERIQGYMRFDGHPDPVEQGFLVLEVSDASNIVLGQELVSDRGGKGRVLLMESLVREKGEPHIDVLVLVDYIQGFQRGDDLGKGAEVLNVFENFSGHGVAQTQVYRKAVRDYYSSFISPIPGSGPIRGVAWFNGDVYAFRDNDVADETMMWVSSPDGWRPVHVEAPRVYSPPYDYEILILAGASGANETYLNGRFRTGTWYGEVLWPRDPDPVRQAFRHLTFSHPTEGETEISFDPGRVIGDIWELQVYINDVQAYRFNGDMTDVVFTQQTANSTEIKLTLDDSYQLWLPNQRIGIKVLPMAERPLPENDSYSIAGPDEIYEGDVLTYHIEATDQAGQPALNRQITWSLEGVQPEDFTENVISGTVSTGATGAADIVLHPVIEGFFENERITLTVVTPAKHRYTYATVLHDTPLLEQTYSYYWDVPKTIQEGDIAVLGIKAVNPVGAAMKDVRIDWRATGAAAPDHGTVITDISGYGSFDIVVPPGSQLKGITAEMLRPLTSQIDIPVLPYPVPTTLVFLDRDAHGVWWALQVQDPKATVNSGTVRTDPAQGTWQVTGGVANHLIYTSRPLKLTIWSFRDKDSRTIFPQREFDLKLEVRRKPWVFQTATLYAVERTVVNEKVKTQDNGAYVMTYTPTAGDVNNKWRTQTFRSSTKGVYNQWVADPKSVCMWINGQVAFHVDLKRTPQPG